MTMWEKMAASSQKESEQHKPQPVAEKKELTLDEEMALIPDTKPV